MLRLLVDTCVWLDLAKDIRGEHLIAATRTLVSQGRVELLVPQVIVDEYDRNRSRVVESLAAGSRAHIKFARAALAEHGRSERLDELVAELDDVAGRGPLIEQLVVNRFEEVRDLLVAGVRLEVTDDHLRRVVDRGLNKHAPYQASKNSTGDALLVELFATAASEAQEDPAHHYAFVSSNTRDFSDPKDTRRPHPDLASCFSSPRAEYYTALKDVFALHEPDTFIEDESWEPDPRTGQEILAAEQRFFDLVWYQRSLASMHPLGAEGRQRVEGQYAPEELGRLSEFESGMLHGKLSALRWVLGNEWDFLDT